MMARMLVLLACIGWSVISQANINEDYDRLQKFISPYIEGDTLYIQGKIDSHIYDFMSIEYKAMANVKVIDLDSFGGRTSWAMEVARKIQKMGLTTRLRSGHYCASSCAYLFAAGRKREAATDTWLGIHGARVDGSYATTFQGLCFIDLENGSVYEPRKKGCGEFLAHWYDLAMGITIEAFAMMEANGVAPSLRETYFAMPDDPDWPAELNVLRKPDWVLEAPQALAFHLVTDLL